MFVPFALIKDLDSDLIEIDGFDSCSGTLVFPISQTEALIGVLQSLHQSMSESPPPSELPVVLVDEYGNTTELPSTPADQTA